MREIKDIILNQNCCPKKVKDQKRASHTPKKDQLILFILAIFCLFVFLFIQLLLCLFITLYFVCRNLKLNREFTLVFFENKCFIFNVN